ncbi:MAG TPA: type II toxin-antitoxin system HipA family toxin YjjJ [Stenotrophomonas sp.]|nr:type II toxin-antitoxin system HipA family toxin YjjJ [Stenotrophomonas sp.]
MAATPHPEAERIRQLLRSRGRLAAADLLQTLEISRPTLGRLVTADPSIVRLGKARATQYALRHEIRGESQWPLYRMRPDARIEPLGTLLALDRGEFALESTQPRPVLMHPPFERGIYPDVPWFLDDLRPNGFLGRTYAHRVAEELRVPSDLKVWNAGHIIAALLHGGSTQSGDLILGDQAMARALRELRDPPDRVEGADRLARYPQFAAEVLRGEPPGCSPGGEQAKFTATVEDGSAQHAVIVKFSHGDDSPAARRWATLLRCEALAASVLASRGIAAAETSLLESNGQLFLESRRFDRTPGLGRRGFISLAALDAAFYGEASISWWRFADMLERDGWLGADDALALRRVSWFGALIDNTDMHLGNFGLMLDEALPLSVAPVYDMLPMRLRPTSQGTVVAREYVVPVPVAGQYEHWRWAAEAALEFWQRVQGTAQIEPEVQAFAQRAASEIRQLANHL